MKLKNAGFSLVELIIVIAIMAILIGVLAPQYIKYVEKSRVEADRNTAESLLDAAHSMVSDEEYIGDISDNDTITFNSGGIAGSSTGISGALEEYFSDDLATVCPKSKSFKTKTYTVTFSQTANGDFLVLDAWN